MRADLAKRYFTDDSGIIPELMVNVFPELLSKSGDVGSSYKITNLPGADAITSSAAVGSCRGLFYSRTSTEPDMLGVFGLISSSAQLWTVSSNGVATSTAGVLKADSDLVAFAASPDEIMMLSGSSAYTWDGATLTHITDADAPTFQDIAYLGGRFLGIDAGTPDIYYSALNDGSSWTATGFFTAASEARALCVDREQLYVFCNQHIEVWGVTADPDSPYQRLVGANIDIGFSRFSYPQMTKNRHGIFFIGADLNIYRLTGLLLTPIAPPWLVRRIYAVGNPSVAEMGTFRFGGQTWVSLFLGGSDWYYYNVELDEWFKHAPTSFSASSGLYRFVQNELHGGDGLANTGGGGAGGNLVVGVVSATSTANVGLYTLTRDSFVDYRGAALSRQFSACLPLDRGAVPIDTIALTGTPGRTSGGSPTISMELSRDGGQTYGSALSRSIGATASYSQPVLFQGLGEARPPGLTMRFTISSSAAFDVLAVRLNEEPPF